MEVQPRARSSPVNEGALGGRRATLVSLHPMGPGRAASTHLSGIARGLEELGWRVCFTGVRSHSASEPMWRRAIGWLTTQLRASLLLMRGGVLYLRSHPAALPLVVVARWRRIPIVVEVNGPDDDYFAAWPQLRRVPWMVAWPVKHQLRSATAIIAVTEGLASWATELSGERPVTVIPNAVDASRFASPRRPPSDSDPYVVFVGALAPWQGVGDLLAAAGTSAWPREVQLHIAGDGSEAPSVQSAAERHPGRIKWLGHVHPDRVPELLADAVAAAVLSRDRRGTGVSPIKLYEAMAAGLPVIVADVPGAADTVREARCGLVVPVGDPGAIANAVRQLATNPEHALAMGRRGQAAVIDRHTWTERAAATETVLRGVGGGGRRL